MSVVLCLPAHLCVSPQRPVAGPPRERVNSVVSRLCFAFSLTLLHCPAVGKVGKPRWGHPLVEFVIVDKIRREIDQD